MDNYKKLSRNTIILFVANFGSKLLNLLLVPFYSYLLTTEEYGTSDLITTLVGLFLPALSLVVYDSAMRFAMDKETLDSEVLTESLHIFTAGLIGMIALAPILYLIPSVGKYSFFLPLFFLSQGIYQVFSQYSKGIGHIKRFAFSGILFSIVFIASNFFFLLFLKYKIEGFLLSYIVAYLIAAAFSFSSSKMWKDIHFLKNYKKTRLKLIKYGTPLIVNAIIWWIIISSDKLFLTFMLGSSANGIYTVAYKIPSILTMIGTIFIQAWTISSIETLEQDERQRFLNRVLEVFVFAITTFICVLISCSKFAVKQFLSSEYEDAWRYVPLLLWVSAFSLLSQFWSAFYLAEKNTFKLFLSSLIAGGLNVILNAILIPFYGIFGATFASAISCFAMWICRIIGAKKFIFVKFKIKYIVQFLLAIAASALYYSTSTFRYFGFLLIVLLVVALNYKIVALTFKKIFFSLKIKK